MYGSVEEFVASYLLPLYRRAVSGQGTTWCAQWWRHPEAWVRLDALWRAWEYLRLDPATGMSVWLRDHADPHMAVLLSADGPFRGCKPEEHSATPAAAAAEHGDPARRARPDPARRWRGADALARAPRCAPGSSACSDSSWRSGFWSRRSPSPAAAGRTGPSGDGEPALIAYYIQAAARYALGPDGYAYLAAINHIETQFGTDLSTSSAGAEGWMQFEPATFAQYGVSVTDPTAPPDPSDPQDAIYTAARYLAASGAPSDWGVAIYAYNHAAWYVTEVEGYAQRYSGPGGLQLLAGGHRRGVGR